MSEGNEFVRMGHGQSDMRKEGRKMSRRIYFFNFLENLVWRLAHLVFDRVARTHIPVSFILQLQFRKGLYKPSLSDQ